jgi:hypothetical protein
MAFTDAPGILTALRDQLVACASWTGNNSTVHYPFAKASGQTGIYAVLAVRSSGVSRRFVGVSLPSGSLEIHICSPVSSIGALETLARAIANEIVTETGIENLQVTDIGEADTGLDSATVESGTLNTVTITLSYGLE